MASNSDEEVYDTGDVGEISDEEIDNMEYEVAEQEKEEATHVNSDDSGASDIELEHNADEVTYTGKDGTKLQSTEPSPAAFQQHSIIHVHPGMDTLGCTSQRSTEFFLNLYYANYDQTYL